MWCRFGVRLLREPIIGTNKTAVTRLARHLYFWVTFVYFDWALNVFRRWPAFESRYSSCVVYGSMFELSMTGQIHSKVASVGN